MKRIVAVIITLVVVISSSLCVFGNEEYINADKIDSSEKRLVILYNNDASTGMQEASDMELRFSKSIEPRIKKSIRLENLNMEIITIDENEDVQGIIDELMKNELIESVHEDIRRDYLSIPNDPMYNFQWGLTKENVDISKAWELSKGGSQTVVAVIDSGIYSEHEDLKYRIVPGGRNFSLDNNDEYTDDTDGHGTWVSGVIAAQTNNGIGISGVVGESDVGILPIKVGLWASDLVQAIEYAVDKNVDVINVSMGGSYYRPEEEAIQRAISENIVIVAAAGNAGHRENEPQYPASYTDVISVGSIDRNEEISYFSNYNSAVDIVAPGEEILTTNIHGEYNEVDGTSFATPFVAGVCAMLKSLDKSLTPNEIENILTNTAIDRGKEGKDNYYGYGMVNPVGAINSILIEDEEYKYEDEIIDVPLDKEWTIKFNDELNSDTINMSNIYIIDSKYRFVDCKLSLLDDKKSVTITPQLNYNPNEKYNLIVSKNVQSINNEKLVENVRMKFATED